MPDLLSLTRAELGAWAGGRGVPEVHVKHLWGRLHREFQPAPQAWADLPARSHRAFDGCRRRELPVVRESHSSDGHTRKYLLELEPGRAIETVLMRYEGRVTACLSTQAGCAMGCVFCATGQQGFGRHLTAAEIVAQAHHVARVLRAESPPARLRNIVFMGMGEPLHNYEAVMQAVDILRDPGGLALAADRISVSTVGHVPGIRQLTQERRPVQLAVSLHGATQEARAALVPAARRWPLEDLMQACRSYIESTGKRIFYEWTLIEGQNDSPEHARAVGHLLQGQYAQVNLIPLNPTQGFVGGPTDLKAARRFQQVLDEEFSLPSTVRQRRGIDIDAGCGQLANREKEDC